MLREYITMAILVFSVRSICETGEEREDIMNAYEELPDKKFLGSGGFGAVHLFPYGGKVYAVKKIILTPHRSMREEIRNQNSPSLIKAIEKINDKLVEYYYFEEDLSKQKVHDLIMQSISTRRHIPYLQAYVNHMMGIAENVNDEMRINRKLGTAQLDDPDRMKLNFNFCVRDSGFSFYLFQDKYGDPLDSDDSEAYLNTLNVVKRLKLYMLILKRLKFVHDQGIVHCDIKPANILWTDDTHKDVVVVDYGIAVTGKEETCNGGTRGYRAPEIVEGVELSSPAEHSFKADVYSFGALMADLEARRKDPNNSFVYAKAKLEEKNILLDNYNKLMSDLEDWMDVLSIGYGKARPSIKQNFAHYYDQLKKVLLSLLDPDYTQRPNLNMAYRHIWYLYQLCRKINLAPEEFDNFAIDLRMFLNNYPNKDDYFTLPEELPVAKLPLSLPQIAKGAPTKANLVI